MTGTKDDLSKVLQDATSSTGNNGNYGKKDVTTSSSTSSILSHKNPIIYSSCSIRGNRPYMEDEYFISEEGQFAAVFDGHGGSAVSQYLRQNLYAYVQAALPSCVNSLMEDEENGEKNEGIRVDNHDKISQDGDDKHHLPDGYVTSNNSINETKNKNNHKIVQSIVEKALRTALSKVDHEVQGISHWSFQGSTALALLFYNNPYDRDITNNTNDENNHCDFKKSRYIAIANVGDSRAVLSRKSRAIDLSQDHKPDSPLERRRIELLGGRVDWCGEIDLEGNPVKDMGVYRINGNLALSRAIGDRSERPWVTSEADVRHFLIEKGDDCDGVVNDSFGGCGGDEFVVLATDGLFDVFSSQAVVDFIHGILENSPLENEDDVIKLRKNMAKMVVEEALRKGTFDNVTVLVLWLN